MMGDPGAPGVKGEKGKSLFFFFLRNSCGRLCVRQLSGTPMSLKPYCLPWKISC